MSDPNGFREPTSGSLRGVLEQIPPQDLDELNLVTKPHRQMPYAPPAAAPKVDPIQLASLSIKSVYKVGADAAAEINEIAEAIAKASQEVIDKLHALSEAVQHHHAEAALAVEAHCQRTTSILAGIRTLEEAFHKPQEPSDAQNNL